jgi:hypothetical protein
MRAVDRRPVSLGVLLLLGIILALLIGCGGGTPADPAVEVASAMEIRTFSDFGFSFQSPKDYLVWQDGLLDEDADEYSGLIQVAPEQESLPLLAVSWLRTWQYGLEGGLEAGFEGVTNWEGVASVTKGELVQAAKTGHRMLYQEGHRMLYQYFTATTDIQGEILCGVVGVFYCPDTQRAFSLVTLQNATGDVSSQQTLDQFEHYMDSLVCHE